MPFHRTPAFASNTVQPLVSFAASRRIYSVFNIASDRVNLLLTRPLFSSLHCRSPICCKTTCSYFSSQGVDIGYERCCQIWEHGIDLVQSGRNEMTVAPHLSSISPISVSSICHTTILLIFVTTTSFHTQAFVKSITYNRFTSYISIAYLPSIIMARTERSNPFNRRRGTAASPERPQPRYKPLSPDCNYLLKWSLEGLEDLQNKIIADFEFCGKQKSLQIEALKWPSAYLDPHNMLEFCLDNLRHLEHIEVIWRDGDPNPLVAKDANMQRDASMRVLQAVVAALKSKAERYHNNPQEYEKVNSLVLDGVYWDLFATNDNRFQQCVSPYLQHLALRFAPVSRIDQNPQTMNSVGNLGRILRSAPLLKTLELRFASESIPSGIVPRTGICLPLPFQYLFLNTVFPSLTELTLENIVLDPGVATKFFQAHTGTLKVIELISLVDSSSITKKESPVTRVLTGMRLNDLQFRGRCRHSLS